MEVLKSKGKIFNIVHKKTIHNNTRYNSPVFQNYSLINDDNSHKKNLDSKISRYNQIMNRSNTTISKKKVEIFKDKLLNFTHKKLFNSKPSNINSENSKIINYIKRKITYEPIKTKIISKRNNNEKFLNKFKNKGRVLEKLSLKNLINSSENILKNKNYSINNNTIYYNKNNNNSSINKKFYSSKYFISLDNILSNTINKNHKKGKLNSLEKEKNLKVRFSQKKINRIQFQIIKRKKENSKKVLDNNFKTKINLDKNKKNYRFNERKENKIKSQNDTKIMGKISQSSSIINDNGKRLSYINHINKKIDKNDKIINLSKHNFSQYKTKNDINCNKDYFNLKFDEELNGEKILCENNSTNDKSLKTKTNSNRKKTTPNIIINKFNECKKKKFKYKKKLENDWLITYELDVGKEQNNKINGIKINNFDVKKPQEQNLKFAIIKEEKDSEISCSHASKIIIGRIDGYKDIIETDIQNREKNTYSKCFKNSINKNFGNSKNEKRICGIFPKKVKKKITNLSTLLKKECEPINFNEYNFYDSFSNNLDGISSTITNNIIGDKKLENLNIICNSIDNINSKNNRDFNNISFLIKADKSIEDISKIVNQSITNDNNKEIISNNDINYNNKIDKENKIEKKDKLEEINNICEIF